MYSIAVILWFYSSDINHRTIKLDMYALCSIPDRLEIVILSRLETEGSRRFFSHMIHILFFHDVLAYSRKFAVDYDKLRVCACACTVVTWKRSFCWSSESLTEVWSCIFVPKIILPNSNGLKIFFFEGRSVAFCTHLNNIVVHIEKE